MRIKTKMTSVGTPIEESLHIIMRHINQSLEIKAAAEKAKEEFIKASPNDDIAKNWSYTISRTRNSIIVTFNNTADIIKDFHYRSNGKLDEATKNGVNIAIIVDTGHSTGDGKWIEGKHYLAKATDAACDAMVSYLRKETLSK